MLAISHHIAIIAFDWLGCKAHPPYPLCSALSSPHKRIEIVDNIFSFNRLHSIQGTASYRYEYLTPEGNKYSFIAVDACPDPGPRRPFNFFGLIDDVIILTLISNALFYNHLIHTGTYANARAVRRSE